MSLIILSLMGIAACYSIVTDRVIAALVLVILIFGYGIGNIAP